MQGGGLQVAMVMVLGGGHWKPTVDEVEEVEEEKAVALHDPG